MSLDCEMDQNITGLTQGEMQDMEQGVPYSDRNPGLVLKVSLVNDRGETVLDTLVDYQRYSVYTIDSAADKENKKSAEPKKAVQFDENSKQPKTVDTSMVTAALKTSCNSSSEEAPLKNATSSSKKSNRSRSKCKKRLNSQRTNVLEEEQIIEEK